MSKFILGFLVVLALSGRTAEACEEKDIKFWMQMTHEARREWGEERKRALWAERQLKKCQCVPPRRKPIGPALKPS